MSFFTDWRSHYAGGFVAGLALRLLGPALPGDIWRIDRWAWEREQAQNLAGKHPNNPMSGHQQREAMAWGAGARLAAGVKVAYPADLYGDDAKWA